QERMSLRREASGGSQLDANRHSVVLTALLGLAKASIIVITYLKMTWARVTQIMTTEITIMEAFAKPSRAVRTTECLLASN
ncbi:MAG: hypothetical protein AAFY31_10495, partial [Pseudomonadota bacterium]